jgi:hypothetical protein
VANVLVIFTPFKAGRFTLLHLSLVVINYKYRASALLALHQAIGHQNKHFRECRTQTGNPKQRMQSRDNCKGQSQEAKKGEEALMGQR